MPADEESRRGEQGSKGTIYGSYCRERSYVEMALGNAGGTIST